ncbi:MAG: rod shape-determining protein RodA, partial [Armatimonadota bacterium]|nr:rod shape-determining protein RodA [Armatimonadota bacterium]
VYLHKQLFGIACAVPVLLLMWRLDYHSILRRQWAIYSANLFLLLVVLLLGHAEVKGAQRWISLGSFRLQPSEIAKLCIIITLAAYLASRKNSIRSINTVVISLVHIAVPALIIFRQPDLGTALVILTIWLVMTFVAGVRVRHLVAIILVGALAFGALWAVGGIKPYQKERFKVLLNPQADPQGSGYHIGQSLNAIGSGQLWGKGYLHGSQGQLGYVPEQHTDFIFTIVGEELGFVGSAALVLLYAIFLWRACLIALNAADTEGRLLSAGIVAMFLYHIVVNIGMTIGIMPVT